jgi:hypothetical protein
MRCHRGSVTSIDRLISHEIKSGPGGVPYYDRDKFKPELAEDMKVGDMSVTFKRGHRLQSAGRAARSILPIL